MGVPMGEKYAFVMMIKEKWWNEFCDNNRQGKKIHSYIQKGAAPPKDARLVLFYVTKPVGEIAGYAELIERKVGNADELWEKYGQESVLKTGKQFEEFIMEKQKVSFIRFNKLYEATKPVPLNNVLVLLGMKRLSRKGFYINKEITHTLLTSME